MKVLKVIYYLLICFVGLIGILLVVSLLPISGNIKFLIVQSGSMEPEIKMGDVVMVKPSNDYEIGDVISFGESSNMRLIVTHRIHDIDTSQNQTLYITKGDANNASDGEKIPEKQIVGKVLINIPRVGFIVDFIKKPLGFSLVMIVPAILVISGEVKKIYNETRKNKNKEE